MLKAENIHVDLGRKTILHGIDLAAHAGRVTAIIGPNGSGKTTLMRALTGEIAFQGSATLNGVDIAGAQPWQLAAMRGVLPQSATLAFPFTVHEVVRLGLTSGIMGADGGDLVIEALKAVDLGGFEARFYQELSGGEQQRVQLARVLCQVWEPLLNDVPRFLFLDEPVSSLDIKHQLQIMRIAADYAARGGGVLAIMHDLNLTAAFADHVVLISDGRVFAAGKPPDVLTSGNLERVYDCPMRIGSAPDGNGMLVLPDLAAAQPIDHQNHASGDWNDATSGR
ncbi:MAG: heme ABC transporter ATP-binding protein [Phyllobacteriaceae bacterium]|nr:heme ABC transporter ATP-binding protein [Phyllobacteriaceae bacterium]